MCAQSFYLTTPIYYVNSVPHLGTAYTTVAADALARYRRMLGDDVHFLTGLDEHGQKVEQAATENGMTPQAWVDSIAPKFQQAWEMLDITNDDFIRTTEQRHERGVQHLAQVLYDRGDIYKGHYEGWYCVPDETYWAEDDLGEGKHLPAVRPVRRVRPRGQLLLQALGLRRGAACALRGQSRLHPPRDAAQRGRVAS